MTRMDERMLCGMSDKEVAELNRYLGIIMKNLEEMEDDCGWLGEMTGEQPALAEKTLTENIKQEEK